MTGVTTLRETFPAWALIESFRKGSHTGHTLAHFGCSDLVANAHTNDGSWKFYPSKTDYYQRIDNPAQQLPLGQPLFPPPGLSPEGMVAVRNPPDNGWADRLGDTVKVGVGQDPKGNGNGKGGAGNSKDGDNGTTMGDRKHKFDKRAKGAGG